MDEFWECLGIGLLIFFTCLGIGGGIALVLYGW